PRRIMVLALAVVSIGAAAAGSAVAASVRPPSAGSFGRIFVNLTNQDAGPYDGSAHVRRPHCVEPRPGSYMCAYTVVENGAASCHLMQARWTPDGATTIPVTLAGRTARCATLRQAIQSLR